MTRLDPVLLLAVTALVAAAGADAQRHAGEVCDSGRPEVIRGTPGDDRLVGTPRTDFICGLGGDDTIDGRGGVDEIYGGPGDDTIDGGKGDDWVSGGPGADRIDGGDGSDSIHGEGGADRLFGGRGMDGLSGAGGDDVLHGGAGRDGTHGEEGNDILFGEGGSDFMTGGDGDDRLLAGPGSDELWGGDGRDRLDGAAGEDFCNDGEVERRCERRRPDPFESVTVAIEPHSSKPMTITNDHSYPGVAVTISTGGGVDSWDFQIRRRRDLYGHVAGLASFVIELWLPRGRPIAGGRLMLPYTSELLNGHPETAVRIWRLDEGSGEWLLVPGRQVVDTANDRVTTPITAVGVYAVGTTGSR